MSNTLRILLIDDNPDDRALVIRELRREFPDLQVEQIIEAEGFAQALEVGDFDLVITDYQLRWTDGLAVLRTVKARWPDRPVVMFTATGSQEIAVEAMKNGLEDYVLKSPKHFIRLPAAVPSALKRAKDIAARKRAEEELKKYREYLEQLVQERTAELDAFAYSVSHDLRAPLRAMQGFAQALLEDYADRLDPVGHDYAQRIIAAAQRMDTLIQDLLAYSRLSRAELRLQAVDLEGVVREALLLLEAEIRENDAQVTVEEPLPSVTAHHATLVQVAEKLLSNAVRFVTPGVRPQVRVWAEEREEGVRLCVEDNGIGIAPEHQERIFHVFERLHGIETYPGTGIGLAIVRKGVERMGGRVGVESEVGQGSRFWVELPKVEEKS